MSSTANVTVSGFQAEVLHAFTVLYALDLRWSGALILNLGLDTRGAALSLAAHIAGGVALSIEPNPQLLRDAQRSNACDFVVNTVDEALRAIKNEIRQQRPLSVGVEGDPERLLNELVTRGVAPQLFTAPAAYPVHAARFASWGARLLDFSGAALGAVEREYLLRSATSAWTLESFSFASAGELRAFDVRVESVLPPGDVLRRKWLHSAGRLFTRDRTRSLWLSAAERARLVASASNR